MAGNRLAVPNAREDRQMAEILDDPSTSVWELEDQSKEAAAGFVGAQEREAAMREPQPSIPCLAPSSPNSLGGVPPSPKSGKRRSRGSAFLKAIFLRRKAPSVKDSLAVVGLRQGLLIGE